MLIPQEYAFADPSISEQIGLGAKEHGLLMCEDEEGKKFTLVSDNPDHLRMMVETPGAALAGLEITEAAFPLKREGWPDDWAAAA